MAAAFLLQETGFAAIELRSRSAIEPSSFTLPQSSGIVKDSSTATSPETIVNIKDVHDNYGAQASIVETLENLVANYDIRTIGVEGSEGAINTSMLAAFPDREMRRATADHLMKRGVLSAAEFFVAMNDNRVAIYGMENEPLYQKNLSEFKRILETKRENLDAVRSLRARLERFVPHVYSEELRILNENGILNRGANLKFSDKWKIISEMASRNGVDVASAVNVSRLVRSIALEKAIDFELVNREREKLMKRLERTSDRAAAEELILHSVQYKLGNLTQGAFSSFLLERARETAIEPESYAALSSYADYMTLYESIEIDTLREELTGIEDRIREKIFRNEEERELFGLIRQAQVIGDIFEVKLTSDNLRFYRDHAPSFTARKMTDFLTENGARYGEPVDTAGIDELYGRIAEAVTFYDQAEERNRTLLDNTIRRMREKGETAACLVTGGFHSRGITELMKEGGISYIILLPRFNQKATRPYLTILTDSADSFDAFARSKQVLDAKLEMTAHYFAQVAFGAIAKRPDEDDAKKNARIAESVRIALEKYSETYASLSSSAGIPAPAHPPLQPDAALPASKPLSQYKQVSRAKTGDYIAARTFLQGDLSSILAAMTVTYENGRVKLYFKSDEGRLYIARLEDGKVVLDEATAEEARAAATAAKGSGERLAAELESRLAGNPGLTFSEFLKSKGIEDNQDQVKALLSMLGRALSAEGKIESARTALVRSRLVIALLEAGRTASGEGDGSVAAQANALTDEQGLWTSIWANPAFGSSTKEGAALRESFLGMLSSIAYEVESDIAALDPATIADPAAYDAAVLKAVTAALNRKGISFEAYERLSEIVGSVLAENLAKSAALASGAAQKQRDANDRSPLRIQTYSILSAFFNRYAQTPEREAEEMARTPETDTTLSAGNLTAGIIFAASEMRRAGSDASFEAAYRKFQRAVTDARRVHGGILDERKISQEFRFAVERRVTPVLAAAGTRDMEKPHAVIVADLLASIAEGETAAAGMRFMPLLFDEVAAPAGTTAFGTATGGDFGGIRVEADGTIVADASVLAGFGSTETFERVLRAAAALGVTLDAEQTERLGHIVRFCVWSAGSRQGPVRIRLVSGASRPAMIDEAGVISLDVRLLNLSGKASQFLVGAALEHETLHAGNPLDKDLDPSFEEIDVVGEQAARFARRSTRHRESLLAALREAGLEKNDFYRALAEIHDVRLRQDILDATSSDADVLAGQASELLKLSMRRATAKRTLHAKNDLTAAQLKMNLAVDAYRRAGHYDAADDARDKAGRVGNALTYWEAAYTAEDTLNDLEKTLVFLAGEGGGKQKHEGKPIIGADSEIARYEAKANAARRRLEQARKESRDAAEIALIQSEYENASAGEESLRKKLEATLAKMPNQIKLRADTRKSAFRELEALIAEFGLGKRAAAPAAPAPPGPPAPPAAPSAAQTTQQAAPGTAVEAEKREREPSRYDNGLPPGESLEQVRRYFADTVGRSEILMYGRGYDILMRKMAEIRAQARKDGKELTPDEELELAAESEEFVVWMFNEADPRWTDIPMEVAGSVRSFMELGSGRYDVLANGAKRQKSYREVYFEMRGPGGAFDGVVIDESPYKATHNTVVLGIMEKVFTDLLDQEGRTPADISHAVMLDAFLRQDARNFSWKVETLKTMLRAEGALKDEELEGKNKIAEYQLLQKRWDRLISIKGKKDKAAASALKFELQKRFLAAALSADATDPAAEAERVMRVGEDEFRKFLDEAIEARAADKLEIRMRALQDDWRNRSERDDRGNKLTPSQQKDRANRMAAALENYSMANFGAAGAGLIHVAEGDMSAQANEARAVNDKKIAERMAFAEVSYALTSGFVYKADLRIMLGLFLQGKSAGLMAGGGKTGVYYAYQGFMRTVMGNTFSGVHFVENEGAVDSQLADKINFGYGSYRHLARAFGLDLKNGVQLQRSGKAGSKELQAGLNSENTLVVLDYTSGGFISNTATKEDPELREAIERNKNRRVGTVDELHLIAINKNAAVLGTQARKFEVSEMKPVVDIATFLYDFRKARRSKDGRSAFRYRTIETSSQNGALEYGTYIDADGVEKTGVIGGGELALIEHFSNAGKGQGECVIIVSKSDKDERVMISEGLSQKMEHLSTGGTAIISSVIRGLRASGKQDFSSEIDEQTGQRIVAPIGQDGSPSKNSVMSDTNYQAAIALKLIASEYGWELDETSTSLRDRITEEATAMVRLSNSSMQVAVTDAIGKFATYMVGASGTVAGLEDLARAHVGSGVIDINASRMALDTYEGHKLNRVDDALKMLKQIEFDLNPIRAGPIQLSAADLEKVRAILKKASEQKAGSVLSLNAEEKQELIFFTLLWNVQNVHFHDDGHAYVRSTLISLSKASQRQDLRARLEAYGVRVEAVDSDTSRIDDNGLPNLVDRASMLEILTMADRQVELADLAFEDQDKGSDAHLRAMDGPSAEKARIIRLIERVNAKMDTIGAPPNPKKATQKELDEYEAKKRRILAEARQLPEVRALAVCQVMLKAKDTLALAQLAAKKEKGNAQAAARVAAAQAELARFSRISEALDMVPYDRNDGVNAEDPRLPEMVAALNALHSEFIGEKEGFKYIGKVIMMDRLGWTGRDYKTKDGIHGSENGIDLFVFGFEDMSETEFIQLTKRNRRNTSLGDRFLLFDDEIVSSRVTDLVDQRIGDELIKKWRITDADLARAREEGAVDYVQRLSLRNGFLAIRAIGAAKNRLQLAILDKQRALDGKKKADAGGDKTAVAKASQELNEAEKALTEAERAVLEATGNLTYEDKLAVHAKLMATREISAGARFSANDTVKNRIVTDPFTRFFNGMEGDFTEAQREHLDRAFKNALADKSIDASIVARMGSLSGAEGLAAAGVLSNLEVALKAWRQVLWSKEFDGNLDENASDEARDRTGDPRVVRLIAEIKQAKLDIETWARETRERREAIQTLDAAVDAARREWGKFYTDYILPGEIGLEPAQAEPQGVKRELLSRLADAEAALAAKEAEATQDFRHAARRAEEEAGRAAAEAGTAGAASNKGNFYLKVKYTFEVADDIAHRSIVLARGADSGLIANHEKTIKVAQTADGTQEPRDAQVEVKAFASGIQVDVRNKDGVNASEDINHSMMAFLTVTREGIQITIQDEQGAERVHKIELKDELFLRKFPIGTRMQGVVSSGIREKSGRSIFFSTVLQKLNPASSTANAAMGYYMTHESFMAILASMRPAGDKSSLEPGSLASIAARLGMTWDDFTNALERRAVIYSRVVQGAVSLDGEDRLIDPKDIEILRSIAPALNAIAGKDAAQKTAEAKNKAEAAFTKAQQKVNDLTRQSQSKKKGVAKRAAKQLVKAEQDLDAAQAAFDKASADAADAAAYPAWLEDELDKAKLRLDAAKVDTNAQPALVDELRQKVREIEQQIAELQIGIAIGETLVSLLSGVDAEGKPNPPAARGARAATLKTFGLDAAIRVSDRLPAVGLATLRTFVPDVGLHTLRKFVNDKAIVMTPLASLEGKSSAYLLFLADAAMARADSGAVPDGAPAPDPGGDPPLEEAAQFFAAAVSKNDLPEAEKRRAIQALVGIRLRMAGAGLRDLEKIASDPANAMNLFGTLPDWPALAGNLREARRWTSRLSQVKVPAGEQNPAQHTREILRILEAAARQARVGKNFVLARHLYSEARAIDPKLVLPDFENVAGAAEEQIKESTRRALNVLTTGKTEATDVERHDSTLAGQPIVARAMLLPFVAFLSDDKDSLSSNEDTLQMLELFAEAHHAARGQAPLAKNAAWSRIFTSHTRTLKRLRMNKENGEWMLEAAKETRAMRTWAGDELARFEADPTPERFLTDLLPAASRKFLDHTLSFDEIGAVESAAKRMFDDKIAGLVRDLLLTNANNRRGAEGQVNALQKAINDFQASRKSADGKPVPSNIIVRGGVTLSGEIFFHIYTLDSQFRANLRSRQLTPVAQADLVLGNRANDQTSLLVVNQMDTISEDKGTNVAQRESNTLILFRNRISSWTEGTMLPSIAISGGEREFYEVLQRDLPRLQALATATEEEAKLLEQPEYFILAKSGAIEFRNPAQGARRFPKSHRNLSTINSEFDRTYQQGAKTSFDPEDRSKNGGRDKMVRKYTELIKEKADAAYVMSDIFQAEFPGKSNIAMANQVLWGFYQHEIQHIIDDRNGLLEYWVQTYMKKGDFTNYQRHLEISAHLRSVSDSRTPFAFLGQMLGYILHESSGEGYTRAAKDIFYRLARAYKKNFGGYKLSDDMTEDAFLNVKANDPLWTAFSKRIFEAGGRDASGRVDTKKSRDIFRRMAAIALKDYLDEQTKKMFVFKKKSAREAAAATSADLAIPHELNENLSEEDIARIDFLTEPDRADPAAADQKSHRQIETERQKEEFDRTEERNDSEIAALETAVLDAAQKMIDQKFGEPDRRGPGGPGGPAAPEAPSAQAPKESGPAPAEEKPVRPEPGARFTRVAQILAAPGKRDEEEDIEMRLGRTLERKSREIARRVHRGESTMQDELQRLAEALDDLIYLARRVDRGATADRALAEAADKADELVKAKYEANPRRASGRPYTGLRNRIYRLGESKNAAHPATKRRVGNVKRFFDIAFLTPAETGDTLEAELLDAALGFNSVNSDGRLKPWMTARLGGELTRLAMTSEGTLYSGAEKPTETALRIDEAERSRLYWGKTDDDMADDFFSGNEDAFLSARSGKDLLTYLKQRAATEKAEPVQGEAPETPALRSNDYVVLNGRLIERSRLITALEAAGGPAGDIRFMVSENKQWDPEARELISDLMFIRTGSDHAAFNRMMPGYAALEGGPFSTGGAIQPAKAGPLDAAALAALDAMKPGLHMLRRLDNARLLGDLLLLDESKPMPRTKNYFTTSDGTEYISAALNSAPGLAQFLIAAPGGTQAFQRIQNADGNLSHAVLDPKTGKIVAVNVVSQIRNPDEQSRAKVFESTVIYADEASQTESLVEAIDRTLAWGIVRADRNEVLIKQGDAEPVSAHDIAEETKDAIRSERVEIVSASPETETPAISEEGWFTTPAGGKQVFHHVRLRAAHAATIANLIHAVASKSDEFLAPDDTPEQTARRLADTVLPADKHGLSRAITDENGAPLAILIAGPAQTGTSVKPNTQIDSEAYVYHLIVVPGAEGKGLENALYQMAAEIAVSDIGPDARLHTETLISAEGRPHEVNKGAGFVYKDSFVEDGHEYVLYEGEASEILKKTAGAYAQASQPEAKKPEAAKEKQTVDDHFELYDDNGIFVARVDDATPGTPMVLSDLAHSKEAQQAVIRMLPPPRSDGERIWLISIGAGRGDAERAILKARPDIGIIAIDINAKNVAKSNEMLQKEFGDQFKAIVGDAHEVSAALQANSIHHAFEGGLLLDTIGYLDADRAFASIGSVLEAGAPLIVTAVAESAEKMRELEMLGKDTDRAPILHRGKAVPLNETQRDSTLIRAASTHGFDIPEESLLPRTLESAPLLRRMPVSYDVTYQPVLTDPGMTTFQMTGEILIFSVQKEKGSSGAKLVQTTPQPRPKPAPAPEPTLAERLAALRQSDTGNAIDHKKILARLQTMPKTKETLDESRERRSQAIEKIKKYDHLLAGKGKRTLGGERPKEAMMDIGWIMDERDAALKKPENTRTKRDWERIQDGDSWIADIKRWKADENAILAQENELDKKLVDELNAIRRDVSFLRRTVEYAVKRADEIVAKYPGMTPDEAAEIAHIRENQQRILKELPTTGARIGLPGLALDEGSLAIGIVLGEDETEILDKLRAFHPDIRLEALAASPDRSGVERQMEAFGLPEGTTSFAIAVARPADADDAARLAQLDRAVGGLRERAQGVALRAFMEGAASESDLSEAGIRSVIGAMTGDAQRDFLRVLSGWFGEWKSMDAENILQNAEGGALVGADAAAVLGGGAFSDTPLVPNGPVFDPSDREAFVGGYFLAAQSKVSAEREGDEERIAAAEKTMSAYESSFQTYLEALRDRDRLDAVASFRFEMLQTRVIASEFERIAASDRNRPEGAAPHAVIFDAREGKGFDPAALRGILASTARRFTILNETGADIRVLVASDDGSLEGLAGVTVIAGPEQIASLGIAPENAVMIAPDADRPGILDQLAGETAQNTVVLGSGIVSDANLFKLAPALGMNALAERVSSENPEPEKPVVIVSGSDFAGELQKNPRLRGRIRLFSVDVERIAEFFAQRLMGLAEILSAA